MVSAAPEVLLEEQLKEVRREIAQRKRFYPRFIQTGGMTSDQAAQRIATMEAVARTIETLLVKQRPLI